MLSKKELVEAAHKLKEAVDEGTSQYYHSATLIDEETAVLLEKQKSKHSFQIEHGIKDIMLVGALTQSSVLMTGGTDVGKTTLARLVMNSLFGEEDAGWHRIDVDIDFGKDAIVDADFGVIAEGKKVSEGFYRIAQYLLLPGLITDEINRSHAKLITKLMHIFDKDVSLPDGKRVKIGYEFENGRRYQFQVSAINEGEEYSGTFDIDKALRRRTVIEIPMDIFPPTPHDRDRLRKEGKKDIDLMNKTSHIDDVIGIYTSVGQIRLHPNAALFLSYLESFDYCAHSLTQSKGSIASKGGSIYHVCTKPVSGSDVVCHFIRSFENELCPYIRAITPGISKNLVSVAKGLALLRAVKFAELLHAYTTNRESHLLLSSKLKNPEIFDKTLRDYVGANLAGEDLARAAFDKYVLELSVMVEDIEAVFGFVGYSKIGLSQAWVAKHYQGNRFEAVRAFMKQAKEKFEEGVSHLDNIDISGVVGSGLAQGSTMDDLIQYCNRENPWFLVAMQPHIAKSNGGVSRKEAMGYLYR